MTWDRRDRRHRVAELALRYAGGIRQYRSEIRRLRQRFENDDSLKPVLDQAAALDKKMAPVEEELIQVNMKGSAANLAFPNRLNEQLDSFSAIVPAGDGALTQQQYEVFKMLLGQRDQQLAAWTQITASDVPLSISWSRAAIFPLFTFHPREIRLLQQEESLDNGLGLRKI